MLETRPTKENARAYFELYMSRKESALAEFKARSEATDGPKVSELDYSEQSLIPLWLWVRDKTPYANQRPQSKDLPPWYEFELVTNPYNRNCFFTAEAAQNLDGLAYYYGEVLVRQIPDAQWSIDPFPASLHFGKPNVMSEFFNENPLHTTIVRACIYNETPQDIRVGPNSLLDAVDECKNSEMEYKEYYVSNGNKHVRAGVSRRINFK